MKTMPSEGMRKRAREWLYNADHPNECASEAEVNDLATLLDEVRESSSWDDVVDTWTPDIRAAFPTRSGSHDEYGLAMQMVGHRHSKGELVALVNWLLVELKSKGVTFRS